MSIVDVLSIVVFLSFGLIGFKAGFLSTLKSLVALILSYIGSILILKPLLNLLGTFGLRENLVSPIIIFVFLVIVLWGIIFSLEMTLLTDLDEKIPRWIGAIPGLVFGILVCQIIYLVLFGFFGENKIVASSKICPYFISRNLFGFFDKKPFISKEEAFGNDLILSQQEQEILMIGNLPDFAPASSDLEAKMINMINEYRRQNGLDTLESDPNLAALAEKYADEILKTKRFSHYDQNGHMPQDRALAAKIDLNYMGENLAVAPNLASAHNGLLASSAHRENILRPLFRRVGIAVLQLNNTSVLVVQEFSN